MRRLGSVVAILISGCVGPNPRPPPDWVTPLGIRIWEGDDAARFYDPRHYDTTAEIVQELTGEGFSEPDLRVRTFGRKENIANNGECWIPGGPIQIYAELSCLAQTALPHEMIHFIDKQAGRDPDYDHRGPSWQHMGMIRKVLEWRLCAIGEGDPLPK